MKKLLLATLFASTTFAVNAQEITFSMAPFYPPFESTNEKNEIVGFDVDLANALCAELKATCKFNGQDFDSLITGLKAKKFDAIISGMDITDARAKQVNFTAPYYENTASFIALKGKADLATAKTVAVQNGTTHQQYVNQELKQYNAKSYAQLPQSLLDLQNGRVDLIFGDTAILNEWVKKDPNLQFVGEKITNPKFFGNGVGIAVNKSNKELLDQLNNALTNIKNNGEYQKVYDKWFAAK